MSTPDEDKKAALAEELKATANTHFQAEQYNDAISYYSQAIDLDPSKAVYFANRSISHLRLENFGYALDDASKAIAIDRKYLKAYYRRAAAYMALGKFKLALKDYEAVHKAKPSDKDAKTKFVQCRKRVQQIAFNKAIAVKEKIVSLVESLNLENMAVEESYEGPRLSPDDNYAISKEFMVSLLDYYKNLK
ncbi:Serine/threonineprotein phosphatase 5like, partial [Caligus rogercresseyi]